MSVGFQIKTIIIASTSTANFQHEGQGRRPDGKGETGTIATGIAGEDTGAAAGEVQERLGKLAVIVARELQKGVDIGGIAAARAEAMRR